MNEPIVADMAPLESQPNLVRQVTAIAAVMVAFCLFVFPIPLVAADAAGFNLRQETDFGKAITNPLAWVAGAVPPYRAYIEVSHRLFETLYAS